jgi:hypothetical protein
MRSYRGRFPKGIAQAAAYIAGYAVWILSFRLVVLTLITYSMMSPGSHFQEISDAYGANELMIMGLGSFLFVVLLRVLAPLTLITTDEIFTPHRFEKRFAPGFLRGAVLASSIVAAFLLSGLYRYWGFFIQPEEGALAFGSVLLRVLALVALAYSEEFVFRYRIMNLLRRHLPDIQAAGVTAVAFCLVKLVQFDLGLMHVATLLLVSVALAIRAVADGDFAKGAGYWAGVLIVFHPLLGLPILGNDFQGVLLVKYQAAAPAGFAATGAAIAASGAGDSATSRFLTGGMGGPLSSFALQLLLVIDIVQGVIRNKKILLNPQPQRIR